MPKKSKRGRPKKATLKEHVDEIIENVESQASMVGTGMVIPPENIIFDDPVEPEPPKPKKDNIDPFGIHG